MGPSEDLLRTPRTDYQALDQLMLYALKSVKAPDNDTGLRQWKDLNAFPAQRVSRMESLTATS